MEHFMKFNKLFLVILFTTVSFTASCDTVFTDVYDETSRPKLYLFGTFTTIGSVNRANFAELDLATGKPTDNDSSFVSPSYIPIIKDNTVYYINSNTMYAADLKTGTVQWSVSSSYDIFAFAVSDEYVYIGGDFIDLGTIFARLDRDTGSLQTTTVSFDGRIDVMAIAGDTLYLVGLFANVNGEPRNQIAAIDAKSGALKKWYPAGGISSPPDRMWVSGNALYVGGAFATIGSKTRNNMAAVDLETGEVLPFNPSITMGTVHSCAFMNDTIYMVGTFEYIQGEGRYHIGAVDRTTGEPRSWYPAVAIGTSYAITAYEGKVYVGSDFTAINGVTRNHLAAFDGVTGNLLSWNPNALGVVSFMILAK
jgi:outer membrane protein assembly factor BamB